MTFASALLHNIQVHLRLNMAVQMVHTFKLYSTQFTFIRCLPCVYSQVVPQVISRAELLTTEITNMASCLVLGLHVASEVC